MYIEQLAIHRYYQYVHDYENAPDDKRWEMEEPVKPMCLVVEEQEQEWEMFDEMGVAPDILAGD